jgi:tRNA U34 5-methylaminomethyl-2-thiouridine-forming methyltransferase MnmC
MSSLSPIQIKKTADGSNTLYDPALDETYHSLNGALSESYHVYIKNGLLKQLPVAGNAINVLEIGFGTAMNALLSLEYLPKDVTCNYYSLEPYPLDTSLIQAYYQGFSEQPPNLSLLDKMLASVNVWQNIQPNFQMMVSDSKLQDLEDELVPDTVKPFDLVFYDAFAPSRQPEMWSLSSLEKVSRLMKPGALLTTYCAQGQFKRNLKELGFALEHPQGANGKREMTLAFKL